jgi:hypothetical protein
MVTAVAGADNPPRLLKSMLVTPEVSVNVAPLLMAGTTRNTFAGISVPS